MARSVKPIVNTFADPQSHDVAFPVMPALVAVVEPVMLAVACLKSL